MKKQTTLVVQRADIDKLDCDLLLSDFGIDATDEEQYYRVGIVNNGVCGISRLLLKNTTPHDAYALKLTSGNITISVIAECIGAVAKSVNSGIATVDIFCNCRPSTGDSVGGIIVELKDNFGNGQNCYTHEALLDVVEVLNG